MKYSLIKLVCLSLLFAGCSRPFDKLPHSQSRLSPKKTLIVPILKPGRVIGRLAQTTETTSPLITHDRVFLGSIHDRFFAIKKSSGKILWKKTIPGGVESTPIHHDNRLYFGANDGIFYCLNPKDGKTIWTYNAGTAIQSSPVVKGDNVYFLTAKNALYALKAATGKWVWYYNRGYIQKISMHGSSSPVYYDGKIYVGFSDGTFYALNAFTGKEIWFRRISKEDKFMDVDVPAIVSNGRVFVGSADGFIYALKASTGETIWKQKYNGIIGLTDDDRYLYLTTQDKKVVALSKQHGRRKWKYEFQQGTPTIPILVEDQVIFGTTKNYVYSLQKSDGSEIWRYTTDTGTSSKPAFDGELLFLFTHLSALHILDPFYLLPGS